MRYNPLDIEAKWQKYWLENETFKAVNDSKAPKYYVLDMFPYPSGAGLHVGHPLGYIASDIVARFKRHQGFNVLHPMGYDSFGLPAEQYAIQTGQRPEDTTSVNIDGGTDKEGNKIAGYRKQLDKIGFSFDWSREVCTSNPDYYKHTQWIFIQLFNSWYNSDKDKAEDISTLISEFERNGNASTKAVCDDDIPTFTAQEWNAYTEDEKEKALLKYRLTYLAETEVNWCPKLGTVLANDEIVNGVSERGGHPVVRKKMTQWSMRISAYAERLLKGLEEIDWSESIKESQRNWIGKSVGAMIEFKVNVPNEANKPHPQPLSKVEGRTADVQTQRSAYYKTANPEISKQLVINARDNRKNSTEAELLLWHELRNHKLGFKFRRQHYIGNYIVDFVCLEKGLIIEVDGGYHRTYDQKELDEMRTFELEQKYLFKVIRFTNDDVENKRNEVLLKIKEELSSHTNREPHKPHPQPLSKGEGSPAGVNNLSKSTEYTQSKHKTVAAPLSFGEGLGVRSSEETDGVVAKAISFNIFTTRPDTIFGVTFMSLAPEHPLVREITTEEQRQAVEKYIEDTAKRSERERMADVKTISGVFSGAYAEHPFTKEPIPIWIADYVLAGYGTGAVMAVPAGDERDFAFANHFKGQKGMPEIKNIFAPQPKKGETTPNTNTDELIANGAYTAKEGFILKNSSFLDGLGYKEATARIIEELEKENAGKKKVNYRLRDAVFSRQRYWGKPFPVYYVNGLPKMIDVKHLPIKLPTVEKYLPTEDGQPPLGNATVWAWDTVNNKVVETKLIDHKSIFPLELNTMPGWAGSSWYWMRYMDAHNTEDFASKEALEYWQSVDLYIGGSEHATGHLLYSRFWNKFLKDKNYAPTEEPFKKLINQGMILGTSAFVYIIHLRFIDEEGYDFGSSEFNALVSKDIYDFYLDNSDKLRKYMWGNLKGKPIQHLGIDGMEKINYLIDSFNDINKKHKQNGVIYSSPYYITRVSLDIKLINEITNQIEVNNFEKAKSFTHTFNIITEPDGTFKVEREVEKMSKSKYNVVTPDDICSEYGADTLRLYEMFLGPLEQAKPWNTAGISGVFGFLKKLCKLYFDENGMLVTDIEPTKESLKTLHKTIKKTTEDIENFSFNTSVSQFMICVNELTAQKCHSRAILEPLAIVISPYAPHLAEELWSLLGKEGSIAKVPFPVCDEKHLVESSKEYPVSFNGKMRFTIELPLDLTVTQIEEIVLKDERTIKHLEGRKPNKVIIVPGKIINLVG